MPRRLRTVAEHEEMRPDRPQQAAAGRGDKEPVQEPAFEQVGGAEGDESQCGEHHRFLADR